ncbi:hypothetical protein Salat_0080700 [Sesamum alatum]|uniref:Serine-rich protein-like protein n=1 Tax=Sesamum alatum TaxID=300844 RepID=A0AAE1YWU2_9LAMI|nr:hypothetical protein Salat_0080700 [Sesamum alatum]
MAEESKPMDKPEKPKMTHLCIPTTKSQTTCSIPSSPGLKKTVSLKNNCLCSPTTHAGSFRCRYHRSSYGLRRSSMSVGSKLSELANKSAKICETLQTQLVVRHNEGA